MALPPPFMKGGLTKFEASLLDFEGHPGPPLLVTSQPGQVNVKKNAVKYTYHVIENKQSQINNSWYTLTRLPDEASEIIIGGIGVGVCIASES